MILKVSSNLLSPCVKAVEIETEDMQYISRNKILKMPFSLRYSNVVNYLV